MGQTAHSLTCSFDIQGGMNVRESYSPALEQGTLLGSLSDEGGAGNEEKAFLRVVQGGDSIAFNFMALIIAPDSSKY